MSELFRKEVLDKQGQKLYGDVILASPISHMAMTVLLAVIITGLVLFSIFGEYSRKERVRGFLTPDSGLIRIIPRQSGLIDKIHVKAGESVQKGQILFTVKLDTTSGNGQETVGTLLEQLKSEQSELQSRLTLVPQEYEQSKRRIWTQYLSTRDDAEKLLDQIAIQKRSVNIENNILEKYKRLLKNEAASSLEVSSQENRYLQSSITLQSLESNQRRLISQANDFKAQHSMLPIAEQKEISNIRSSLHAIAQRLTQAQSQESYVIVAPISGRIASVTARMGQLTSGQKALANILPIDGKMEAELLVPTRAAGFIESGQKVRLLYDAFPYQKFGFHSGYVVNVSKTIVMPNDLPISQLAQEPVFLVTVTLDHQIVDANNEDYPLQAGMTLGADIILEDRKIWEWVFEPILGAMK